MRIFLFIISLIYCGSAYGQDLIWAKQISGLSPSSAGVNMRIGKDKWDNYYLFNYFSGTLDFDPGPGTYNMTSSTSSNYYLEKLDNNGNFIWARQFSVTSGSSINIWGMDVDSMGFMYLVGNFTGTVDFDPGIGSTNISSAGLTDVFILKVDSSGSFVWVKTIGAGGYDYGLDIKLDKDLNILVGGEFQYLVDFDPGLGVHSANSTGYHDNFILKLSSSGQFMWLYTEGSTAQDQHQNLSIDNWNNVYLCNKINGIVHFSKLNSLGNIEWTKVFDGDVNYATVTSKNSDVFLTGTFFNAVDFDWGTAQFNLSSLGQDIFLMKVDTAGNFMWVKQISGTQVQGSHPVQVDDNGDLLILGGFDGTCDFDPGTQQYLLSSVGTSYGDLFMLKLNSTGDFVFVKKFGNDNPEFNGGGTFNSVGEFVYCGNFSDTLDADPGPGVYDLVSNTFGSLFILKLSSTLDSPFHEPAKGIKIYPNPSSGDFTITSNALMEKVRITDITGKLVYQLEPRNYLTIIHVDLPTGLYHLTVQNPDKLVSEKILITQ